MHETAPDFRADLARVLAARPDMARQTRIRLAARAAKDANGRADESRDDDASTDEAVHIERLLRAASGASPTGLADLVETLGQTLLPAPADVLTLVEPLLADAPASMRSRVTADALTQHAMRHSGVLVALEIRAPGAPEARNRVGVETPPATEVVQAFEARRMAWARRLAIAAALCAHARETGCSGAGPAPLPLALTARDVAEGRPLAEIPLMRWIMSVAPAADATDGPRRREAPTPAAPARPPGDAAALADILARSGLPEPWLDGFLVALAAAPQPPAPERWLDALVRRLRPESRAELEAAIEPLFARAAALDEACSDATALRERLAAYDEAALAAFASGFCTLTEAAPGAWRSAAVGATGRRLIAELSKSARAKERTGDLAGLRPLLPSWIASMRNARR